MPRSDSAAVALLIALPVLVALPAVLWFRRRRRDEIFVGVTPGEVPGTGQAVTRRRVGRGQSQWSGPIAVRFTPPDAMTPGLVGTVIDGSADVVDVSATLIDLAVRGYLRLHAESPDSTGLPASPPLQPVPPPPPPARAGMKAASGRAERDWRLIRLSPAPAGPLLAFEQHLLDRVFAHGDEVTISELKRRGFDLTMREAQIGLYREVVDRGWYGRHPRDRNRRLGCLGLPLFLVGLGLVYAGYAALPSPLTLSPHKAHLALGLGAGLAIAAVILLVGMRGRTPRTAEGTAARIQALGFREYLTKAEAGQIRFEEARDLFSRYLPYAMVFGVADRWARTFAEVAAQAHLSGIGDAYFDLSWLDGVDLVGNLAGALIDSADVGDLVGGIGDLTDGLDLDLSGLTDVLGNGLTEVTGAAGDFVSSASGLLDFGDGCGGCDGCDGCDPFS